MLRGGSYKIFFIFCLNLLVKCEETDVPYQPTKPTLPILRPPAIAPTLSPRLSDRYSSSSYVSEEGNFHFFLKGIDNGISIDIYGSLKDNNGTKTLELSGDYKFGNISLRFTANELGFYVRKPEAPFAPVPQRVIATVLGK